MPEVHRQTIIEFVISGQFGQVNAIDVDTGIEVTVIVPAQTSKLDRETLALKKLALALSAQNSPSAPPAKPASKRGLIA
jgi:hypothetical protein